VSVLRLVRHAQASFGKRDYDALSRLGHEQAEVLGRNLGERGVVPGLIIRGDMRRHRETVDGILAGLGSAIDVGEIDVLPDAGWDELDFQHVVQVHRPLYRSRTAMVADLARTGKPRKAFQRVFDEATLRWAGGEHEDDYHESFTTFTHRVIGALSSAVARAAEHKSVLVVSSGGPIAVAASDLLVGDASLWATLNRVAVNTGVTKVISGGRGLTLATYNEHGHLEADRRLLTYR